MLLRQEPLREQVLPQVSGLLQARVLRGTEQLTGQERQARALSYLR